MRVLEGRVVRPIAEHCLQIDFDRLVKTARILPGKDILSNLCCTVDGQVVARMHFEALMEESRSERLIISFWRGSGWSRNSERQVVKLVSTETSLGGQRWWMLCPSTGQRCLKLFLPSNGTRFASGKAWRVSYASQRVSPIDRPFEQLFRLQRKLGCKEGYELPLIRPKRMWRSTFEKYEARYWALAEQCDRIMQFQLSKFW